MSGMGWMEISERMSTAVLMNTCMHVCICIFRQVLPVVPLKKNGECLLLDAPTVIN